MFGTSAGRTVFAAAAIPLCLAGLSCANGKIGEPGDLKLAFILPDHTTINSVTYTVLSSSNIPLASGALDVTDPNATVSIDLSLPSGTGDTIQLTATTSVGVTCAGTSSPFDVIAGQTSLLSMTVTCGGGPPTQPGRVDVQATIVEADNCPSIMSAVVSPIQTSVGSPIDVRATASDPDISDTLSYSWTPATRFTSPTAVNSTFVCEFPGMQTLTLTVSDDHQPTPCMVQFSATVVCVGVDSNGGLCGDGVVGPAETCEPPGTPTCDTTCQLIRPTGAGPTH